MLNKNLLIRCLVTKKHLISKPVINWQTFRSLSQLNAPEDIQKFCDILRVPYDFDEKELRNGYLESCKRTHPDLNEFTDEVDPNKKFASIEMAYNRLKDYLKTRDKSKEMIDKLNVSEDEEQEEYFKHKVAQHRQYLNYDGIGFGTPAERQKQYQKYRLMKTTNRVIEFQLNKIKSNEELSENKELILKDFNRQPKIKQGFERLVEDLIQESMAKGDFDNLPGYGKPLKYRPEYPYLDSMTVKLNEILINSGFVPEWVLLEREIRDERIYIKTKLLSMKSHSKLDNILFVKQILAERVAEVNRMIDKYNRIVPIFSKQQNHLILEKEVNKIRDTDDNCIDNCAKSDNQMNDNSKI